MGVSSSSFSIQSGSIEPPGRKPSTADRVSPRPSPVYTPIRLYGTAPYRFLPDRTPLVAHSVRGHRHTPRSQCGDRRVAVRWLNERPRQLQRVGELLRRREPVRRRAVPARCTM